MAEIWLEIVVKRQFVSLLFFWTHFTLQLGSGGGPAKIFHGVGIGPLSKIVAVKLLTRCFHEKRKTPEFSEFSTKNNHSH